MPCPLRCTAERMNLPSKKPCRRSTRLQEYDYTQSGAYFVTMCAYRRLPLFGTIARGELSLTALGLLVEEEWQRTEALRPNVILDEFIVMPNHFHGIVLLVENPLPGTARRAPTAETFGRPVISSLPTIVRSFKSAVTRSMNELRSTPGQWVWQRNYYEHVIRDDRSLERIRDYISIDPPRWSLDRENPHRTGVDEFDAWLCSF